MPVDAFKACHNLNVATRLSRRLIWLPHYEQITRPVPFEVTQRRFAEL